MRKSKVKKKPATSSLAAIVNLLNPAEPQVPSSAATHNQGHQGHQNRPVATPISPHDTADPSHAHEQGALGQGAHEQGAAVSTTVLQAPSSRPTPSAAGVGHGNPGACDSGIMAGTAAGASAGASLGTGVGNGAASLEILQHPHSTDEDQYAAGGATNEYAEGCKRDPERNAGEGRSFGSDPGMAATGTGDAGTATGGDVSMPVHPVPVVVPAVSAETESVVYTSMLPLPIVTLADHTASWAQNEPAAEPVLSPLSSSLPPPPSEVVPIGGPVGDAILNQIASLPQPSLTSSDISFELASDQSSDQAFQDTSEQDTALAQGAAQLSEDANPALSENDASNGPGAITANDNNNNYDNDNDNDNDNNNNNNNNNNLPVAVAPVAVAPSVPHVPSALANTVISNLMAAANANPNAIQGANVDFSTYLYMWALGVGDPDEPPPSRPYQRPMPSQLNQMISSKLKGVRYDDLRGDRCDFQGVDWHALGVSRKQARDRRTQTYKNYTNHRNTDSPVGAARLRCSDNFFRFHKTMLRRDVVLSHFQLRSLLACPTRTQAFYPGTRGVHRLDTAAPLGSTSVAIDLSDAPSLQVTTLDANNGILVAGTFNGEYFLRRIDSDKPDYHNGIISEAYSQSSITNHLQLYQHRGSGPTVAFASNDSIFRVMDVATEQLLFSKAYKVPMNCTAVSPDKRLRVMVGDLTDVMIVGAETGEVLVTLSGHKDFGFSCDWSQDGRTIATGFQDKTVKIWDARRWRDSSGRPAPVASIESQMAGVRALRFSPVGSGSRVLVAAEEADMVNIIEARLFQSKQMFDLFGEVGGVSFSNEGNDLNVLLCDRARGGVVKFEHSGMGFDWKRDDYVSPTACFNDRRWAPGAAISAPLEQTWSNYSVWDEGPEINLRRRAAVLDRMEPF